MRFVKLIDETDIPKVAELEKEIFSDAWTEGGIKESFEQKQARIAGAYVDGELKGYLIIYYVLDEAEIARIAVSEDARRLGLAGELMDWLLAFSEEHDIERILLDVRESNVAARAFYTKWGFQIDGIRKRFYTDPVESAVLMSRDR
ncbi:MAG: ribosomal protein S18-alanine N-acetyltransferase [Dorea sp.]|nr:ribosomal protein S18-alanine N-acetyltransferase [Dorea sp.]